MDPIFPYLEEEKTFQVVNNHKGNDSNNINITQRKTPAASAATQRKTTALATATTHRGRQRKTPAASTTTQIWATASAATVAGQRRRHLLQKKNHEWS